MRSFRGEGPGVLLTGRMANKFCGETERDWACLYILQTTCQRTGMTVEMTSQAVIKVSAKMSTKNAEVFGHSERIRFFILVTSGMKRCL